MISVNLHLEGLLGPHELLQRRCPETPELNLLLVCVSVQRVGPAGSCYGDLRENVVRDPDKMILVDDFDLFELPRTVVDLLPRPL